MRKLSIFLLASALSLQAQASETKLQCRISKAGALESVKKKLLNEMKDYDKRGGDYARDNKNTSAETHAMAFINILQTDPNTVLTATLSHWSPENKEAKSQIEVRGKQFVDNDGDPRLSAVSILLDPIGKLPSVLKAERNFTKSIVRNEDLEAMARESNELAAKHNVVSEDGVITFPTDGFTDNIPENEHRLRIWGGGAWMKKGNKIGAMETSEGTFYLISKQGKLSAKFMEFDWNCQAIEGAQE